MSPDSVLDRAELAHLRAGRAVATTRNLDVDDSHAVHEQLARLRFVRARLDLAGKSILDFGCGAGYVLDHLAQHASPGHLAGIDCDPEIVAFARRHYPGIDFRLGDAAQSGLDLGRRYDVVLSFEVLEHVDDQGVYLENMVRHLRPGGVLVVSTPNRAVFSLGESVSIHNATHRHELDRAELERMLRPLLAGLSVHGQRFRQAPMQRKYVAGTRHLLWRRRVRDLLHGQPFVPRLVRSAYDRLEDYHDRLRVRTSAIRRAKWDDFEFVDRELERCVWFIALGCRP